MFATKMVLKIFFKPIYALSERNGAIYLYIFTADGGKARLYLRLASFNAILLITALLYHAF